MFLENCLLFTLLSLLNSCLPSVIPTQQSFVLCSLFLGSGAAGLPGTTCSVWLVGEVTTKMGSFLLIEGIHEI